jgi:GT2 family glycosyltransferase
MDANASVVAALAAYRSGRAADARALAEEVWRVSSDARAAAKPKRSPSAFAPSTQIRRSTRAHGIRLIDGVFLAMQREIAVSIGWDAETCDGFHGYDVDFTLRAAQAGLRPAVASDLGVVHRSYGSFDARWEATARKLTAKYPELNGSRSRDTAFVARTVPDAAHAMALVDN